MSGPLEIIETQTSISADKGQGFFIRHIINYTGYMIHNINNI